jgi:hypothetical protein
MDEYKYWSFYKPMTDFSSIIFSPYEKYSMKAWDKDYFNVSHFRYCTTKQNFTCWNDVLFPTLQKPYPKQQIESLMFCLIV